MMTLQERCLNLPYKDRLNLCEALRNSLLKERIDKRHPPAHRGAVLLRYMEDIMGEPIPVKCKMGSYMWARTMVGYQLTKEGYSTTEAGKMMDKNHSTIINMRDRMSNVLRYPDMYKDVIGIWNQFQNKIQDETDTGTNQDTISLGGEFPDCGQSTMGKESG